LQLRLPRLVKPEEKEGEYNYRKGAATRMRRAGWRGCTAATSTLTEGVVMAFSMAAMMAASAVPFFFAYGRDRLRPVATAMVVLIYAAIWALIGFTLNYMIGMVMMPPSFLL